MSASLLEPLGEDYVACPAGNISGKVVIQGTKASQGMIIFCDHCHSKGHTKDKCFQLIEYHANWKFNDKGKSG